MNNTLNCYFRFIVPSVDRPSLEAAKQSILRQTFQDLHIIVVHDGPENAEFSLDYDVVDNRKCRTTDMYLKCKRYNGGARNAAISYPNIASVYTMFLDDDDVLINNTVLSDIYDVIQKNDQPDMIRLPYTKFWSGSNKRIYKGMEDNVDMPSVCSSSKVAAWTKCIKSDLIAPFPENTLNEDVVQHILQCDRCKTYAHLGEPVVIWNQHTTQTSKGLSPKWNSSRYRFIADLMDLQLNHDWAKKVRDRKIHSAIEALWETQKKN